MLKDPNKKPKIYTVEEWLAEGENLFGKAGRDWKYVCPLCGHIQSGKEFEERTNLGVEEIQKKVGYSCIGRHLRDQNPLSIEYDYWPIRMEGGGCNYTLGGIFRFPGAEIINPNAKPGEQNHYMFKFYVEGEE